MDAPVFCDGAAEEAAEGEEAYGDHAVDAHYAAADVFGEEGLDEGLAADHGHDHEEAGGGHEGEGGEEGGVLGEEDEGDAEAEDGAGHVAAEAFYGFAAGHYDAADDGAEAYGGHESAVFLGGSGEDFAGVDGDHHEVGDGEEGDDGEVEEEGFDVVVGVDEGEAVEEVGEAFAVLGGVVFCGYFHAGEAVEDGEEGEGVEGEADAFAEAFLVGAEFSDFCDDDAGDAGSDDAGHVEG